MKRDSRIKRHQKIRKNLMGESAKPRLSVFRSGKHIYAQIIDDTKQKTLVFASSLKVEKGQKREKAYNVGKDLAKKALKLKIKKVVFDRGGFLYHGRVMELGKGAREGGLEF